MTNWTDLANFIISFSGLIVSSLGLVLTASLHHARRENQYFFLALFTILIFYCASSILDLTSMVLGAGYRTLSVIAMFLESLLSSLLMPLITGYFLQCIGEDWRKSWLFRVVGILWAVYFIELIVTQFTPIFYYFTEDNVYHRGPLYPLLLVPPVLIMIFNFIGLIRRREKLSSRQRKAFLVYLLVPMVCMLIQMFAYGLLLIVLGLSIGAIFTFLYLLVDQQERALQQAEQNIRQQASIAVLQMRPPFIYNTMTSIYYLCREDPQRAQQVILDFSSYLRKNFTAIAQEEMIPFTQELEHTRAYLAVEQVRFENKLFVEFDTPYTTFRLPPLTLQPIVENAVKHGVDPELEPLHILVSTRRTDRGVEITVTDSGPGVQQPEEEHTGIALDNIRQRLELLCGGQLLLEPGPDGGTTVTIRIPPPPKKRMTESSTRKENALI